MAEQDDPPDDAKDSGDEPGAEPDALDAPTIFSGQSPTREPFVGWRADRSPDAETGGDLSEERDDNDDLDGTVEKHLDAVNAASGQVRGMWLGFLGLVAYLFIAIAGVTHADLLLNSDVTLPIVNVAIPLFGFFIAAPALFVLVHLGLLIQHAMLSQKIERFLIALDDGIPWGCGPHPMRSRLHAYTQTQLLAGPWRSAVVGAFLHLMSWLTLYGLPVLLLLYFQFAFLPYHAEWVTAGHATALAIDLLIVILIGVFIACPSPSFWRAFLRICRTKTVLALLVTLVTPVVVYMSVFVLTVPDRGLDAYRQRPDDLIAWAFAPANWLTKTMFVWDVDRLPGETLPVWKVSRNLIVRDEDLVPDRQWEPDEPSHSLRGRDLRFAVLNGTDLHRADLTGSDLSGAYLNGTRLEKALLVEVGLQRAQLLRADLRETNFWSANLLGAGLGSADLRGADLEQANLRAADLFRANLQGAAVRYSGMQGSILSQADLRGADLEMSNLRGAHLDHAQLQGANLMATDLRGAVLSRSDLRGANLDTAELVATDLRAAVVWKTRPPVKPRPDEVDLTDISLAPPAEGDRQELLRLLAESKEKAWGRQMEERLAPLLDPGPWQDGGKGAWTALSSESAPDPTELSRFLARLACDDDERGAVTRGLVRRGLAEHLPGTPEFFGYNGDRQWFAREVTGKSCTVVAGLPRFTKDSLCKAAAWPAAQLEDTICAPATE